MNPTTLGFVSLIGAGPGDPELITVKGLNRLRQADVVLYDRLVAPALLQEIRAGAEAINVGKAPTRHRLQQAEINSLLVEKGRQGLRVARLKGGDPFVFGRGGEECQALAQAGISFEVIPGVSSSVAVPAYAGIPVTQRGVTVSFTVIAGHTCDPESGLDWPALTRVGTLVFLMGVGHLPEIRSYLLQNGMASNTPVAVIEQGTTSGQRVIIGSLDDILPQVQHVRPPAIIVIGEVVRMRQEITWFESLSETFKNPGASLPESTH